ncbi:hypothetical protein BT93_G2276 [Corymbia citriodora subsp. variegata]|nr:hypothetical protein BT93_G2276 [Corymbia citriodora subsp. variegata]
MEENSRGAVGRKPPPPPPPPPLRSRSPSQRRCAFARRCARLVSEQRARFYIVRRCVTMLLCWRDYGD